MNRFDCPRHGPYSRTEGVPEFVPARCSRCTSSASSELENAKQTHARAAQMYQRWQRSEVPKRYRCCTVASWQPLPGQEQAAEMLDAWRKDLHARREDGEGLLLMGAPGIGKTHLLAGLVAECIASGYSARYASWPEVWDHHRPPFDGSPEVLMRELCAVEFLALDEIGVRTGTEREQARLFELIDSRYRQSLPTLVATNATQDTLPMIGERTADRLLEACIPIVIPGDSNRLTLLANFARRAAEPIGPAEPVTVTSVVSINGEEVEQTHIVGHAPAPTTQPGRVGRNSGR